MWLPALALRMVRLAASRLPRMKERMLEEWNANLDDIAGHAMKVRFAAGLLLKLCHIGQALPDDGKDDRTVAAAVGSSAGTSSAGAMSEAARSGDVVIRIPAGSISIASTPAPSVSISTSASISPGAQLSIGASMHPPSVRVTVSPSHPAYGSTVAQPILPLGGSVTRDRRNGKISSGSSEPPDI